jgi:hypothetical protein
MYEYSQRSPPNLSQIHTLMSPSAFSLDLVEFGMEVKKFTLSSRVKESQTSVSLTQNCNS